MGVTKLLQAGTLGIEWQTGEYTPVPKSRVKRHLMWTATSWKEDEAARKAMSRNKRWRRTNGRRLAAASPPCSSLPDMAPCLSASVALLVILPLLYLLYVLVTRRSRAPKRRHTSCVRVGLHASNPHGIYDPVEPYFDLA